MNVEQQFGGVNERIHPFLLPQNTYSHSEGVVYRSGKGCRVNGKKLQVYLGEPILSIFPFGSAILIQTKSELAILQKTEWFPIPSGDSVTLTTEDEKIILTETGKALASM